MKRKTKGIAIGMVALATLFGGAQPAIQAQQTNVPASERQTKPNEAIIPQAKPGISRKQSKSIIPGILPFIEDNGYYNFTSPIWYGKSQRAKHFNKKRHGKSLRRKHSR